jgi:predicted nucleic acid-binding protein
VIFDTDIFIRTQKGNERAALLIDGADDRLLSVLTYMELLQCAQNRRQHECTRGFLRDFGFRTLPLSCSALSRDGRTRYCPTTRVPDDVPAHNQSVFSSLFQCK